MSFGLRRALARPFPHPAAQSADPAHAARLTTYLTDMVTPYGLTLPPRDVQGQSYGEMATALIADLLPGADEAVDLLVLAYDIPDIAPGRATATYLSHICPGAPMAFAVSDQGRAAAHTAVRIARDYAASGTYGRALLLFAEQAWLPYDPGLPVTVPATHTAVGLLLGEAPAFPAPRILADVDQARVADELASLSPATVILGSFDDRDSLEIKADTVILADTAQPMTGVWSALAGVSGPGLVAIADYDPVLRYLCVTAFDLP